MRQPIKITGNQAASEPFGNNDKLNLATCAIPANPSKIKCTFLDEKFRLIEDRERALDGLDSYEFMDVDILRSYQKEGLCKNKKELQASGSDVATRCNNESQAIRQLVKEDRGGGLLIVKNTSSKKICRTVGRVYPENNTSIRSLRGCLRILMTYKNMVEVDVINCHATILYQVATVMKIKVPNLSEFVQSRNKIRADVRDTYGATLEQTKALFVRILYGGTFHNWYVDTFNLAQGGKKAHEVPLPADIEASEFIKGLENEMETLSKAIVKYNEELALSVCTREDSQSSETLKPSRVVSYFCQEIELRIVTIAYKTLHKYGLIKKVWFPFHDGIVIPQYRCDVANVEGIKATLRNEVYDQLGIFVSWELKGVELNSESREILEKIDGKRDWESYFDQRQAVLKEVFAKLDDNAKLPAKVEEQPVSLKDLLTSLACHINSSLEKVAEKDFGDPLTIDNISPKQAMVLWKGTCIFGGQGHEHLATYEDVAEDGMESNWKLKSYSCRSCGHDMRDHTNTPNELWKTLQQSEVHKLLMQLPIFEELVAGDNDDISFCTRIFDNMRKQHEIRTKHTKLTCETPILTNKRTTLKLKHRGQLILDQTLLEGPHKVEMKYNRDNLTELTERVFGKWNIKIEPPKIVESLGDVVKFDQVFLEKWKSTDNNIKLTYFLKGSTGLGKTKAIIADVFPLMNAKTTMLQPCPRVSLGRSIQARYNEHYSARGTGEPPLKKIKNSRWMVPNQDWKVGFYKDGLNDVKLIIQVDSLHKLPRKDYEVVIIDELASVLKQFLSTQIMVPDATSGLAKLVHLIKTCRVLILMDADLAEFEVNLILGWRGAASFEHLVFGTHAVATFAAKKFRIVDKSIVLQEYIRDLFFRNKNILFPSSSKSELKAVEQLILKFAQGEVSLNGRTLWSQSWKRRFQSFSIYWSCDEEEAEKRILAILNGVVTLHGDSDDELKKHFIEEGNFDHWVPPLIYEFDHRWLGLRCVPNRGKKRCKVISFNYSPTITAGVSIETDHFHSQYGIFVSASVAAVVVNQMNFRGRRVKGATVAVIGSRVKTISFEDEQKRRAQFLEDMKAHLEDGYRSFPDEDIDRLRKHYNDCKIESEKDLKKQLCLAFNENNFAIEVYDNADLPDTMTSSVSLQSSSRFHESKQLLEVRSLLEEEHVDEDAWKQLDELHIHHHQLDELSLKKYDLESQFGKIKHVEEFRMLLYLRDDLDKMKTLLDYGRVDSLRTVNVVTEAHEAELQRVRLLKLLYYCGFVKLENCDDLLIGFLNYLSFCFRIESKEFRKQVKKRTHKSTSKSAQESAREFYNSVAKYLDRKECESPSWSKWCSFLKAVTTKDFKYLVLGGKRKCTRKVFQIKVTILDITTLDCKRMFWMLWWLERSKSTSADESIRGQLRKVLAKLNQTLEWNVNNDKYKDLMKSTVDEWERKDENKVNSMNQHILKVQQQHESTHDRRDPLQIIKGYVGEQLWYNN